MPVPEFGTPPKNTPKYPKMPVPEFGTPPKNTPKYPEMPAPEFGTPPPEFKSKTKKAPKQDAKSHRGRQAVGNKD